MVLDIFLPTYTNSNDFKQIDELTEKSEYQSHRQDIDNNTSYLFTSEWLTSASFSLPALYPRMMDYSFLNTTRIIDYSYLNTTIPIMERIGLSLLQYNNVINTEPKNTKQIDILTNNDQEFHQKWYPKGHHNHNRQLHKTNRRHKTKHVQCTRNIKRNYNLRDTHHFQRKNQRNISH